MPSSRNSRMTPANDSWLSGSRPENGSSSTTKAGR